MKNYKNSILKYIQLLFERPPAGEAGSRELLTPRLLDSQTCPELVERTHSKNINNNPILPFWLIAIAVVSRLLPHPPNFTAVGSSALYGGRYLSGIIRYIIPVAAMIITDFFLGWHKTMIFVYGALLANVWFGSRLNSKSRWYEILGTATLGSITFYVITNFGVWIMGHWYPHTLSGLINCYVLAIPFAKWTLAGDLLFTTVLFGITAIILNKQKAKQFIGGTQWQTK